LRRIVPAIALCVCAVAGAAELDLRALATARAAESETPACIAVALVGEAARTAFACSPGAGPLQLDADSIFEIGSITKGLTGILLADMVLRGEVKLDDPASKHARPGAKLPTRGGREITLRDLVTHTSSLPRMPPGFKPANVLDPYADYDADKLYAALAVTELARDIGTSGEYSNFGFMWLSEMLSRRGGKPYEALLSERVLAPLGMTSTSVVVPPALQARVVTGHNAFYMPVPPWHDVMDLAGVGGVRSSLADMMKLGEALSGRRSTPIDAAIELSLEPLHRGADPSRHVGYGWFMSDGPGGRIYQHGGGTGGFRTAIAFSREKKQSAVVLADATAGFDDLPRHLLDEAYPLVKRRAALPLDAAMRKQYVGDYELQPGFVISVWEEGERLMSRATGQAAVEYFRQGTDSFFLRVVDAAIMFTRGKDGEVDGLVLHQNGRQVPGKKLTLP
jgi:D-alanyl-D-alanine-carboxypeptidase/D-alanyl-D-alanine-endopeptidase